MYIKEQLNRLTAIMENFLSLYGDMAALYEELKGELPPLRFVDAPAPANSEVKKIPNVKLLNSFHGKKEVKIRDLNWRQTLSN
jgi:hypothetical protein